MRRYRVTPQLHALCVAANDPSRLASFWSAVLGWQLGNESPNGRALVPTDDTGFLLRFLGTEEPKIGKNRMHFDLTSTSLEDQRRTVAKSLELGARHVNVGQRPDEPHVVLADPEGNEFCVVEPGNSFLADCGFVGALACDGSQAVGYFWSAALAWPLIWDQDEETAIRSPQGGPKVTWGGPPFAAKAGKNRLHFDLAPPVGGDQRAEVDRLISLGASRIEGGNDDVGPVVLADPDGNEFRVLIAQGSDA
jgi:catechol 2,3-dioxygenase-like lactoylglutathione lyase family enzyme